MEATPQPPNLLEMGVSQNARAGVTQVLVLGSIYQDASLVHTFEPQPHILAGSP